MNQSDEATRAGDDREGVTLPANNPQAQEAADLYLSCLEDEARDAEDAFAMLRRSAEILESGDVRESGGQKLADRITRLLPAADDLRAVTAQKLQAFRCNAERWASGESGAVLFRCDGEDNCNVIIERMKS